MNHQFYWGKSGPNPAECTPALNGCLTTTLIYHAAAQGVKIDEVESILGRHRFSRPSWTSEKVRNGYEKIKVIFKVKSNAPKKE